MGCWVWETAAVRWRGCRRRLKVAACEATAWLGVGSWPWGNAGGWWRDGMRMSKEREDGGGDSERRRLERARTTGPGLGGGGGYGMGGGRGFVCLFVCLFGWLVAWLVGFARGGSGGRREDVGGRVGRASAGGGRRMWAKDALRCWIRVAGCGRLRVWRGGMKTYGGGQLERRVAGRWRMRAADGEMQGG